MALYRVSTTGLIGATPAPTGDALVVVINNGTQNVLIENFFATGDASRIEEAAVSRMGPSGISRAILAHTVNAGGTVNTQTGPIGDDTFNVDHFADVITETASAGIDTVIASVTFTLPTNIENLILTGGLNLAATGNALANQITGNAGDNRLDGGARRRYDDGRCG